MDIFMPRQYKKEQITIRIPFDKLEQIDRLAAAFHMSRSDFINQCVDFAVRNMTRSERQAHPVDK